MFVVCCSADMGFATVLRASFWVIASIFASLSLCANDEVKYSFHYSVEAGDVITHRWEERRGDLVHGSYSFLQPDGLVRVVEYSADDVRGFKAVVKQRHPPSGNLRLGHLHYPGPDQRPVKFTDPVNIISKDLFTAPKSYPNLAHIK